MTAAEILALHAPHQYDTGSAVRVLTKGRLFLHLVLAKAGPILQQLDLESNECAVRVQTKGAVPKI